MAADYGRVLGLTAELDRQNTELERLMEEWEQLQNEQMTMDGEL